MANNLTVSAAARNAALDAITAKLNVGGAGTLSIYTGTQPATPETALSGNTLLVTLTFSTTSFPAAASGSASANAIANGTAVATGTATFARMFSGGGTPVMDCTVGTSGTDIVFGTSTINTGNVVSISSFSLTHP